MKPVRILVADDDENIRAIVSSSLSILGYEIVEVSDGQEAMDYCLKGLPDVIVLDYMMPGLNGDEVCSRVKKLSLGELTPIIILTARDAIEAKVESFEMGADDYLTKPFAYQELQARVKALVRVRELNLKLWEKNQELEAAQAKLIEQERNLVLSRIAGTAAHQLGQPLSAILLNCHLLEGAKLEDPRHKGAVASIKSDCKRMSVLLDELKEADASKTEGYYGKAEILSLKKK